MANKKLKVELELETAKAKQKLDDMANTGGGGPSGPSPVDDAAKKTAREIHKLGDETEKCKVHMSGAVKAFAGMGVSMAMSYSANYLDQGSTARTAVEYGAGILGGAMAGGMAGSVIPGIGTVAGAVVGGLGGAAKTFFDNSGKEKEYIRDWNRAEHDNKNNQAWVDFMKSINNQTHVKTTYAERIQKANEELKKYQAVEKKQVDDIGKMIADGRYDDATLQRGYLTQNRARQQALKDSIFAMEEASKNDGVRVSTSAVDALSRIGGDFTGGGGRGDDMLRVEREQVELLKSIDRKTGGAAVWQ